MSGFFNQFLSGFGADNVRDYQHAAKTFIDGLYRLSPKTQALFHVYVELNPTVARQDPLNANSQYEIGLMAKSAQLPKFTIATKTYNAYNRKNIVQEKINYDPISITFHDDSSNVVRNFWAGYYGYYYRDADHAESMYNQDYKYVSRSEQNWGFSPDYKGVGSPNYINSIRIYSLSQKNFSSYILFRPTITQFQHGQHTQGEYAPLEHSMTFAYEAMQYEYGSVRNGTVIGFDHMHYDNTPSPIGGSLGGLQNLNAIITDTSQVIKSIQRGSPAGVISGALNALSAAQGTGPVTGLVPNPNQLNNLQKLAGPILQGQNTQSTIFVPTSSSVSDGLAKAVPQIPSSGGLSGAINMNTANKILSQILP